MHRPRIPKNQIPRSRTNLHPLAPIPRPFLKPPNLLLVETEPIRVPKILTLELTLREELLIVPVRPLENEKTTVLGAIRGQVEDSLDALQPGARGALVDVWPGLSLFIVA